MEQIAKWLSSHELILFAILVFLAITFWLLRFEKKLKIQWPEATLVALVHVVVGWSCMRLLALVEVGFDVEKAANMRLFGAIFVLPFLYYAWAKKTKRNVSLVMDICTVCVILGAISGRLNCLTQGCCQGVPVAPEWAFRWPIRQIELAYYAAFILFYFGKIGTKKTYGQVYPIYMISYGIIRFVSEFAREEFTTQVGVLHLAHIWSLLCIVAGAIMLYYVERNRNNGVKHLKTPERSGNKKEETL